MPHFWLKENDLWLWRGMFETTSPCFSDPARLGDSGKQAL